MSDPAENPNSSGIPAPGSPKKSGRRWGYAVAAAVMVAGVWAGVSTGASADRDDTSTQAVEPVETTPPGPERPDEVGPPAENVSPPPPPTEETPLPGGTATDAVTSEPATSDGKSPEIPATDPAISDEEPSAEVAVEEFTEVTAALNAVSTEAAPVAELENFAAGPALQELQVQVDELAANRWRLDGEAEATTIEVVDAPVSGQTTLQIRACIDSSAVSLTDENGAVIQAQEPAGTRRSLNLYDLELRDGAWIVVNHYFPDNADC